MPGIAGTKCAYFDDAPSCAAFIAASVTTVVSLVCDGSGKFVLFYT